MSSPSTSVDEHAARLRDAVDALPVERVGRLLAPPVRFVGFWSAVCLPFLYVPLLFGGLPPNEATAFAGLLGLHLLALVAGHDHNR